MKNILKGLLKTRVIQGPDKYVCIIIKYFLEMIDHYFFINLSKYAL